MRKSVDALPFTCFLLAFAALTRQLSSLVFFKASVTKVLNPCTALVTARFVSYGRERERERLAVSVVMVVKRWAGYCNVKFVVEMHVVSECFTHQWYGKFDRG